MWIDHEGYFTTYGTPQVLTLVADNVSDKVLDSVEQSVILDNAELVIQCAAVPVSAGGGTLNIQLVASAAAALTTPTVMWSTGVLTNATIVAYTANSTLYKIRVPQEIPLRYVGILFTIATAVWTAGSLRAFLTPQAPYFTPAAP